MSVARGARTPTAPVSIPTGNALEVRDGHDFISDAVCHGATGVIVHNEEILLPYHAWRSRFDVRTIAIAGNASRLVAASSSLVNFLISAARRSYLHDIPFLIWMMLPICDGKIKIGVWIRFVFQCVMPPLAIV